MRWVRRVALCYSRADDRSPHRITQATGVVVKRTYKRHFNSINANIARGGPNFGN
jgi:hypothetical protein